MYNKNREHEVEENQKQDDVDLRMWHLVLIM